MFTVQRLERQMSLGASKPKSYDIKDISCKTCSSYQGNGGIVLLLSSEKFMFSLPNKIRRDVLAK